MRNPWMKSPPGQKGNLFSTIRNLGCTHTIITQEDPVRCGLRIGHGPEGRNLIGPGALFFTDHELLTMTGKELYACLHSWIEYVHE